MEQDVIVYDILNQAVDAMVVPNITKVYFTAGRAFQILETLSVKDNSITLKNKKYPLVAAQLPVTELRGSGIYATVTIPRIVIASLSTDGLKSVDERYSANGPFKKILYPCYYEFLKRIAWHPNTVGMDVNFLPHVKKDNPGEQPIGEGLSDWINSIEILNLELILNQTKTCK